MTTFTATKHLFFLVIEYGLAAVWLGLIGHLAGKSGLSLSVNDAIVGTAAVSIIFFLWFAVRRGAVRLREEPPSMMRLMVSDADNVLLNYEFNVESGLLWMPTALEVPQFEIMITRYP